MQPRPAREAVEAAAPERLAHHRASPPEEDERRPVDLNTELLPEGLDEPADDARALPSRAVDAAGLDARSHGAAEEEARGDREALEVLALARSVLGDERDGRVEAREARDARADKGRQDEHVDGRAQAEREGDKGRRDAERDLRAATVRCCNETCGRQVQRAQTHRVGETVELLPEHAALVPPPRDLAVERIEDHAQERVEEGVPAWGAKESAQVPSPAC